MASRVDDDERPGSPLDMAATKIQAVFKGHMVSVRIK